MSKIALLFYGMKPLDCLKKAKPYLNKDLTIRQWKKNVIEPNNCDIFIHCWSPEYESECLENYKPKKYIFENKKNFPSRQRNIFDYGDTLDVINRSHIYSMKAVLELKNDYEQKNNFKYDIVMITRMDTMWFNEINLKDLNPEKIYISPWNYAYDKTKIRDYAKVPYDGWFISNTDTINFFIDLYDEIDNYINYSNSHAIKYYYMKDKGLWDKIDYIFYRFYDFVLLRWLYMPEKHFYNNGKIGDEWIGWLEKRQEHLKMINDLAKGG